MAGYYYIHDHEDFDDVKDTNSSSATSSNSSVNTSNESPIALPMTTPVDDNLPPPLTKPTPAPQPAPAPTPVPPPVTAAPQSPNTETPQTDDAQATASHSETTDNQNPNKPSQKPKLNYLNKKVYFYIYERTKVEPIRLKINDPEANNIDEAGYQRIFFQDFGNMASYNRGIFNRKTPQTPEVYEAKLQTEYDDLTMTTIKDIKEYMEKNK